MRRLDRYILREMVVPFLIGQGAIVMMLTGTVLYNNASQLIQFQMQPTSVIRMVLYFLPFLIHMTMPVAMAVAASLAVSRLARDSEITVMRSAGGSLARIFRPIFLVGLMVSIADFYFGEVIVPKTAKQFETVVLDMIARSPRITPQAGQFTTSADQAYAVYVHTMTPRAGYLELQGIQIVFSPKAVYSGQKEPKIFFAEHGRFEKGKWILERPYALLYDPSQREFRVTDAKPERAIFDITVDPQAIAPGVQMQFPMYQLGRSASRTFSELGQNIRRNRQIGIRDVNAVLDYHFKLSVPFSCLVMALCCPPLALRFGRGGGFMGTLLSICLVFVYWNTLLLARILGSPIMASGPLLPPVFAAWSQNILFTLLGLYFLRKSE